MKVAASMLVLAVCLAACLGSVKAAQARLVTLHDVQMIVQVSEPHFSPDASKLVFVVSRPNVEKARYDAQLVLLNVASGASRQLTYDRKGVSSPRWSPDGQDLAFIASTGEGENDHDQIFLMPMGGGDARQLTKAENDVEQFAWRPDSSAIAYVAADEAKNRAQIKKHNDGFEVGDNDYLTTAAPTPSHIWLIARTGGKARRLTSGSWSISVAAVPSDQSPIRWSPDGSKIAFGRFPNAYYGDSDGANVALLDVKTGAVRRLTDHPGLESNPEFSPSGDALSYQMPKLGLHDNGNDIFVTLPSGGNGRDISGALDRDIFWYRWLPDGTALYIAANDRTQQTVWRLNRQGQTQQLDIGDVMFDGDADVAPNGAIAFVGETARWPQEIYMLRPGGAPQPLTGYNKFIRALELGRSQEISWRGTDGFAGDGVLTYPPHWVSGQKYPLVLVIHGGPESASTQGFADLEQLLAARGYLVFQPNYRGSTNLGDAYERGIVGDTGEGPGKDVMAGIAAVERTVSVDRARIGVSGWSYGGFMTSWLEGHYGIWKAAVAGAALNDWIMDYSISWYVNNDLFYFGGPPFAGRHMQAWRSQSPIAYAQFIQTPTLLLADTYDANVPVVNSYEMFHALRDNHVPVQFVAYPIHPHFPDDPVRLIDVYRRWIAWLDRYLR